MTQEQKSLLTITQELGQELSFQNLRMATAESCTGGLISSTLTDVPGSSLWFAGGVVAYSNTTKIEVLGVPEEIILAHGAVSRPCVEAMVQGIATLLHVPVALAVSGIAGPEGGTATKPVGTVWLAWTLTGQNWSRKFLFDGDRLSIKKQSTLAALLTLLDIIKNGAPSQ